MLNSATGEHQDQMQGKVEILTWIKKRTKAKAKAKVDLKKEEDAEDGGKADEEKGGEGKADSFQRSLWDRKREHLPLVWVETISNQKMSKCQKMEGCEIAKKNLFLFNFKFQNESYFL